VTEEKEKVPVPTPFGRVEVPWPEPPPLKPPKMTKRRHDAMKHATAITGAQIFGLIPVLGDAMADVAEDLHGKELRRLLTEEELNEYTKQDKVAPSVVALGRTFIKLERKSD